jgi:hypothetical protein
MKVYCIQEFIDEFNKLKAKKPYRNLEKALISSILEEGSNPYAGTRLNNSTDTPLMKKRIEGSGGYRAYYLIIVKHDCLYLMFVHPKTGPDGASNILDSSKAMLYKKTLDCIVAQNLFNVKVNDGSIEFNKVEIEKAAE